MPVAPSSDFLKQKAGPLPVWGWGAAGLGAAYAYSRYKANKAAQQGNGTTGTTNAAGESTAAVPQFIIENELPWGAPTNVTVTTPTPVPVTSPPGGSPYPPVAYPGGPGGPPRGPYQPVPGPGPFPFPGSPPPGLVSPPSSPSPVARSAGVSVNQPIPYTVQSGDSLSSIASRYHTTWDQLWAFNTGPASPHSAQAVSTLVSQGPNRIIPGQTIFIPQ